MKWLSKLDDSWFYQNPGPLWKMVTVFVKGDGLILVPFLVFSFLLIVFNREIGLTLLFCFLFLRFLGEMMYWFLQQFGDKTYRPHDFGMKKLSNNSIYILYQLITTVWASLALTGLLLVLFT